MDITDYRIKMIILKADNSIEEDEAEYLANAICSKIETYIPEDVFLGSIAISCGLGILLGTLVH